MRCQPALSHFPGLIFNSSGFKAYGYLPRFVSSLLTLNSSGYRNICCNSAYSLSHGFKGYFFQGLSIDKLRNLSTSSSSSHRTKVTWDEYEDIAELLFERHKALNPLSLRFTDLHEMVRDVVRNRYSLEVSGECSEGALEKIQMSWLELYEQD